ncbi:MAG: acyl-CoA dehydrogenase [Alphaproteobacteria bacterium]|nr:MAG: acyl-CoA dehydrogenase [Alphaproteobacteria bacterium]
MYFGLSEEQRMIEDSFRKTLERNVTLDSIRAVATGCVPLDHALWQELTSLGLPSLLIGEEFGGAELGLLEMAVAAEELGRTAAPVPFIATAVMAPLALQLAGSPDQRERWLPALASGRMRIGVALAEQAAGARRNGGITARGEKLYGKANFTLDAGGANACLIADARGRLYLLDMTAAGAKIVETRTIDGTRKLSEIHLDAADAEPLEAADNWTCEHILNAGRIALAAESLGAAEEMLRRAVEYAKERRQFDRSIASFQAVKHLCAEMAAELEPCQSLVWYAAYAFDHLKEEAALSACLAKSHIDEVARFVARTATEVHGGMGYTDVMGLHFWFKRIGFNRAQLGGPERLRAEAAELQGF